MKNCDFCNVRPSTLTDKTVINNDIKEYHFCEECYKSILKSGLTAYEVMKKVEAERGRVCPVCGTTAEIFQKTFTFGCAECYRYMAEIAIAAAKSCQQYDVHLGKRPYTGGQR